MPQPTKIEQMNRTVHTSQSGIEIVRTFYVEPYDSHPAVLKELQGGVDVTRNADGKATSWERTAPARDTYIRNCYCTECVVNFADPDAMASSLGLQDDPALGTLLEKLEGQPEKTALGTAGAIITAHYRPLITAWKSSDPDNPDDDVWDWIDPQFVPGSRQIAWPDGLYITNGIDVDSVPDDAGEALRIPISDFSIKRMFVGSIPWGTIDRMAGTVNAVDFPGPGGAAAGLPNFAPRTLKFMGADTPTMIDSEGERWYEITYRFRWISYYTDRLTDVLGVDSEGPVTWNHVFTNTSFLGWPTGRTGWYEIYVGRQFVKHGFVIPGFGIGQLQLSAGRLHIESNFMELFRVNAG